MVWAGAGIVHTGFEDLNDEEIVTNLVRLVKLTLNEVKNKSGVISPQIMAKACGNDLNWQQPAYQGYPYEEGVKGLREILIIFTAKGPLFRRFYKTDHEFVRKNPELFQIKEDE